MNYIAHNDSRTGAEAEIEAAVADLGRDDGLVRRRARRTLVEMGQPAVPVLIHELTSSREHVRWEAAKALCELQAPDAAPALVARLEDDNFSVRWLAAEALISLGSASVAPLLRALVRRSDSVWLRQGSHHILRVLARQSVIHPEVLQPVISALEDVEPILQVPIQAEQVLQQLEGAH